MGKSTSEVMPAQTRQRPAPVSRDWAVFAERLTQALSELEEDQFLILSTKSGQRYLQFAGQGSWGLRAEVSSNHFLEGDDRLSRRQMAWLRKHGWNAPTAKPRHATPERDPDGSPNYFIDFPATQDPTGIAQLAIDTLIHALALPYPGALAYEAFDSNGRERVCEAVGLAPAAKPEPPEEADTVLSVFRLVTGMEDLQRNQSGDVVVRYGAIVIFAVALSRHVRLHAELLDEAPLSPALLGKLNQINDSARPLRVFWRDESVHAVVDVPATPFVPDHLISALHEFSEVAEGLAIVLRTEYAGKALIEADEPLAYLQ